MCGIVEHSVELCVFFPHYTLKRKTSPLSHIEVGEVFYTDYSISCFPDESGCFGNGNIKSG